MMKKNILSLIWIIISSSYGLACTTFVLKSGNELVFGRNLDWVSDNGIMVVNQRNIYKSSLVFPPEKPVLWTSKYGSVSFNQFGKEFPFGGMNEKGLVVEIMLADADYPAFDSRPAVNELQWIQYQLDNAMSVDEVIASDKLLRISKVDQELHFLVCDASGKVAVIEFIANEMVVYTGDDLPYEVLENDVYAKSLSKYSSGVDCRFATAADRVKNYVPSPSRSIIDYSFEILDEVVLMGSWSIVYDIHNRTIYFKTYSNAAIQVIDAGSFDFDCSNETLMYDLDTKNKGNSTQLFIPFSSKINRQKMKDAIKNNNIDLPKGILSEFYDYHTYGKCVE